MSAWREFRQTPHIRAVSVLVLVASGALLIWFWSLNTSDAIHEGRAYRSFLLMGLAFVIGPPLEYLRQYLVFSRQRRIRLEGIPVLGRVLELGRRRLLDDARDSRWHVGPLTRKVARMRYRFRAPGQDRFTTARVVLHGAARRADWKPDDPILVLCDPRKPTRHVPDITKGRQDDLERLLKEAGTGPS